MATVLEKYNFRRGRYPDWSQFFDGRIHQLVQGEDFDSDVEKAKNSLYQYAKSRGVKLRIDKDPEAGTITIQSVASE